MIQQEGRYLLMLVSAVMNQKKAPVLSGAVMSWRNIYHLAETNQVAGLSWLGVLGFGSEINKEIRDLFFESYQRELKNVPGYQSAQEVMIWQLERNRIPFIFIEGTELRDLYPHKEMRKMDRLRIWVSKGDLQRVDEIMTRMDYELQENREDDGVLYYKIPGIYVAFYDKLRFVNRRLEQYFDSPIRMFSKVRGYRCLRCFDKEEAYIYIVGRAASEYALGRAGVRMVLDFCLYEEAHQEELNWPYIEKTLKRLKLLEFSKHLRKLGRIWFRNEISDDMEIYNAMEAYILSKGKQGRQISGQILPLIRDVADFYKRDRQREWMNREKECLFPPKEYMEELFPVLKKFPWLYSACCLIRLKRIWYSRVRQSMAERLERIREKLRPAESKEEGILESQEENENNIRME